MKWTISLLVICTLQLLVSGIGKPRKTKNATRMNIPGLESKLPKFLEDSMATFPTWVQQNKFDPSRPVTDRVSLSKSDAWSQISCTIKNQYVSGFSKTVGRSLGGSLMDLDNDFFWVSQSTNGELIFGGDSEASGTLKMSNVTFTAIGKFSMRLSIPAQILFYEYFTLTKDGKYIDFPEADINYMSMPVMRGAARFEGITWRGDTSNANYTDEIQDELQSVYLEFLTDEIASGSGNLVNPASRLLNMYIMHLFKTTPISDILAYTGATNPGSGNIATSLNIKMNPSFVTCVLLSCIASTLNYRQS